MGAELAANPNLLNVCKEMKEVCRAAFRVIAMADEATKGTAFSEILSGELAALGIQAGFASRAEDVIFEYELEQKAKN